MTKNVWKFTGGFLALLILGLAIFYGVQYYQYRQNPEQKAVKEFERIKKLYEEDTYGGFTPEETLQLFIEALKKGDIELASKYFVIDEQEKWREKLGKIKEEGKLNAMLEDLNHAQRGKDISDKSTRFIITNENREVITIMNIAQGPNGKWKIIDL